MPAIFAISTDIYMIFATIFWRKVRF